MKNLTILLVVSVLLTAAFSSSAFAKSRPYRDAYGNAYSNYENLYSDSDGDGRIGMYDRNDSNYWR